MPNQNGREERGGQVRDEKASEGSFLLIFGFLFPVSLSLPFVDVVVTHPALHSLPPAFGFMGFISPACLLAHPLFSSGVTRLENIGSVLPFFMSKS